MRDSQKSLLVARVKLEPELSSSHEPSSSQGPTFIFLSFFFLLLMSSGCYSLLYNDVLVVNGKKLTFRFATFFVIEG